MPRNQFQRMLFAFVTVVITVHPIYKKLGFEDKAQKYTDMRLKL